MVATTNQRHSDLGIVITLMLFVFVTGLAALPWYPQFTLIYIIVTLSILGLLAARYHYGNDEEV